MPLHGVPGGDRARRDSPLVNVSDPSGLGPQYARDDPFTARMRRHQSWYRSEVLRLPFGTGPTRGATSCFGNMLQSKDGEAGRNFLTPGIFAVAERRLAQGAGAVEPFRLKHNMLSSQPMCFNLFGPLVDDLALATLLARALWGAHISRVTRVEIELAPRPKGEYLDDNTAFDAFVEYEIVGGGLGFVGIETKLTEPFSPRRTDKPTYRRWMTADSPWRSDAAGLVDHEDHNQLWRDHLLAWAMLRHPNSPYRRGALAVVFHPDDTRCLSVLEGYRSLLQDQSTLTTHTLGAVVDAWRPLAGGASWLDAFHQRYVDLAGSAACVAVATSPPPVTPARPVRNGHEACVRRLEDAAAYRQTRAMYAEALGGVEVYLRPTDAGFTVLSLDAQSCRSMIGVGAKGTNQHTLTTLPPDPTSVKAAVAGYEQKRESLNRGSAEETYALGLIGRALSSGLALPRSSTYFVTQEWRLPSTGKTDLIGVDPATGRLVIIELKSTEADARGSAGKKGGDAWHQARSYAAEVHAHRRELYPFFQRLARALAQNHDAPPEVCGVTLDPEHMPDACVSWPGGGFVD